MVIKKIVVYLPQEFLKIEYPMKINLRKLSTRDLASLTEQVIEYAKNYNVSDVKNHIFLKELERKYPEYSVSLSKETYSGKGKTVAQINKERIANYRNLKAFLLGYSKLPSAPFYQEGKDLFLIFKKVGLTIDRLNYAEQTSKIINIVELLEQEENTEKLKKLSLEQAFLDIKTSNQNFKKVYNEQIEANTELRTQKSASVIRKELEISLRKFLDQITLMYQVPGWENIYNVLNEYVKSYNKNISKDIAFKKK